MAALTWFLAPLMAWGALGAPAGDVVVGHTAQYPRNGEASAVLLRSGEILLLYGAHVGGGDWDRAVVRAVRSGDGGQTWSEPETLFKDAGRSLFQPSLARLADGRLGLTYTSLKGGRDAHKLFRASGDEGHNWCEPLRISDDTSPYTTGPHNRLYTLSNGRIVALLHCNLQPKDRQGGPLGSHVVYSDDGGRTWSRSPREGTLFAPENPYKKGEWGFWEPSLVEYAPGRLLMLARTATGWLYECRSDDFGATWTPPARSPVANPLAPPALIRVPGSERLLLLHNPRVAMDSGWHGGARTLLALHTSDDAGRSWGEPRTLVGAAGDDTWYDYPAPLWVGSDLHVFYRAIASGSIGFKSVDIGQSVAAGLVR